MKETRTAFNDGTIDDLRSLNSEKYELIEIEFPFGKRRCLKSKRIDDYLLMQKSRCGSVSLGEEVTIKENLDHARKKLDWIEEIDNIRFSEINSTLSSASFNLEGKRFIELGFRTAKLLKHYKEKFKMETFGYDVIDSNIAVANCLNYEAGFYDFNDCTKNLDLKDADFLVSYHMLEHLTNPLLAIKKIYNSMKSNSYFHVEIPIEPNGPNIRYCHMYPFHQGDLYHMLIIAGFEVINLSRNVQKGGPWVERYMAKK